MNMIIGGIAGNVVEWYDFALYGFMIPVLTQLFFPKAQHKLHTITLLILFGLSFFMRPIGALLYGHFGDTRGRKESLIYSVIFMGFPTLLIGCLPTYTQVGYLSAALLVVLRLAQGISAGGELGGSIIFCLEHAPKEKRGFFASLPMTAAMVGVALGSLLPALVEMYFSKSELIQWAWRLPFLASIVIAFLGYLMRKKLHETPVFEKLKQEKKLVNDPVTCSLHKQLREIIKVSFIVAFGGVINYLIIIYVPGYLASQHALLLKQASLYSFFSLAVVVFFILVAGKLSDSINRKVLMLSTIIIALILCWPLSTMLMGNNKHKILLALLGFSTIEGVYFGSMMAYLTELFPANIRYTSLSLGYNLGFAFFAGAAPLLAATLVMLLAPSLTISYIIFLAALISITGILAS